jgi:protein AbiQ
VDYTTDIYQLTQAFMDAYPESDYPELLHKQGRPYSCLLIDTHSDYFICVPFRSHINHKNAFMFHGTQRSIQSKSGLDYTKIILIKQNNYIDGKNAIVDQDEYREVQKNLAQIVASVVDYIDGYIKHVTRTELMHPRQFERRYQYSTLPYFHDIMNIQDH